MALTQDEEFELLSLERERAMAAGGTSSSVPKEKGIIQKGWDVLAIPEKMSREGLTKIAEAIPSADMTGNTLRDVSLNAPKAIAETLSETAPSFVSRSSIATPVILKGLKIAAPVLKTAGAGIAKQAEQLSGLEHKTPGVLVEAANDPTLLFGKGVKRAGELFDQLVDKGRIRKDFAKPLTNKKIIEIGMDAVDNGTLTSEEALIVRRALDATKKKLGSYGYKTSRDLVDTVAKEKSSEADAAFSRAIKSESLRNILPQNKTGGASRLASTLGGGAMVGFGSINPLAALAPTILSPVAQGSVASLLGLLAKGASKISRQRLPVQSGTSSLLSLLSELGSK